MHIRPTEEGLLLVPETKEEGSHLISFCQILQKVGELLEMSGNLTMEWPEYTPFKINNAQEDSDSKSQQNPTLRKFGIRYKHRGNVVALDFRALDGEDAKEVATKIAEQLQKGAIDEIDPPIELDE